MRRVVRCECWREQAGVHRLAAANIPKRYQHCTLENYSILRGADKSQKAARLMAYKFVEAYPLHTGGKGLLLLSCGKSVIRVAPPLVLTPYDVDKGLEILDECLTELAPS